MATLVVQQSPIRQSRTPPPISTGLTLDSSKFKSTPIPNKHIPYCSPGPAPSTQSRTPVTPPASPPSKQLDVPVSSVLYPASLYTRVSNDPPVYSIDAATLSEAMNTFASTSLPDAKSVFPWLHGLHAENQIQLAFFVARRKGLRKTPRCLRGITIVKAGGDLLKSRLKGAIAPGEVIPDRTKEPTFFDIDPKDGFSVRNFHIQAAKMAMVSDIVVYRDDFTRKDELRTLANRIARAQRRYREKCVNTGLECGEYNTFVVSSMDFRVP